MLIDFDIKIYDIAITNSNGKVFHDKYYIKIE